MILEGIIQDKKNFFWTVFHVILGAICTLTPYALIIWFYFIFVTNFNKALVSLNKKKVFFFLLLFFYLISFELLDRMAKTSPFLPYELGKYFLVILGLLGVLTLGAKNTKGILLVLLITPAVFYDLSGQVVGADIINTFLAPLSIGIGFTFLSRLEISQGELNQLLKVLWLTCLSSLVFTMIKTPDLDDLSFSLKAQFSTTGGHSSNQVSTILGFGVFLSFFSIYKKLKFSGYITLDYLFMFLFIWQGLLSFSRGGMVVGVLGLGILLFEKIRANIKRSVGIAILSSGVLIGTFSIADNLTGGLLLLRYQGETEGTLAGSKEKNSDVFTSGRVGIFNGDIDLWMDSPIFGVGCGASRYLRESEYDGNVAAHIEFSRLLAEQGLFGLLYFILLLFVVWEAFKKIKDPQIKAIILALVFIAIATSFHAAMRTYVTPMLLLISVIRIKTIKLDEKNSLYRGG